VFDGEIRKLLHTNSKGICMKKTEFISELRIVLIKRGFDKDTVEQEMVPVRSYFDEAGMEDIQIPVSEMADEITEMLKERQKETEDATKEPDDIEAALLASGADLDVVSDKNAELKDSDNKETDQNPTDDTGEASETPVAENAEKTDEVAAEEPGQEPVQDKFTDESNVYSTDSEVESIDEYAPENENEKAGKGSFIEKILIKIRDLIKKKPKEDDEFSADPAEYEDGKNKTLFWVIFAVAIPVVIALALLVLAIYVAFWIILALLMIFFVAGLIAFVFAGTLISIVGIIYGCIVVIKGIVPVGLFEIGLGITVAAAVMFIGILVYNLAIRLIPFGMKMLARLLLLAFRRGKEGFISFKRVLKTV